MKRLVAMSALGLLFVSASAFAATGHIQGEYGDHCAWGLTQGKMVPTDCSVNWTDSKTHKTYCFSSQEAKADWAKDTTANEKKANSEYAKVNSHDTTHKASEEAVHHKGHKKS